jgi:hypothetical protein
MPSWVSRNVGLDSNVNYIAIHPATRGLSSQNHILLAAADGGVYLSSNGGRQWGQMVLPDPSNAEFSDSPAATVDELTWHWIDFDKLNRNTMFALGVKTSTNRQWIYKTADIGLTWTSRGIVTS